MMLTYRYGLLAPTEGASLVREQMLLAHRYRNALVEIERGRRSAQRSAAIENGDVAVLTSVVDATNVRIDAATLAVKAAKSSARSRAVPLALREELTGARIAKRDAVAALREAQRSLRNDPEAERRREEIDTIAAELRRNARAHCGVYWGTYLLIEDADGASRKMPLYDNGAPNDPSFVRWNGDGAIGVQTQHGRDASEIVDGHDTVLQIARVADRNAARASTRFATLRMRVGSEGRAPVWASFPMTLHREMPVGARVKKATAHLRHIGPREEWYVTIALDTSACDPVRTAGPCGAVAVDVGWRVREGGTIRAARWVGEDGGSGEITLDARTVSGLHLPESLRSQRDRNFNAARAALRTWLDQIEAPSWMREATRHLGLWRSASKLAALARMWRSNRWSGDSEGYDALERWRYHDDHLWRWECDQRSGALRHRKDLYRVAAKELAGRYGLVVLEDFDKRKVALRPDVMSQEKVNEAARNNRQNTAVSELADMLKNAFGGRSVKVDAVDSTHECSACHHVDVFDAAAKVHHACSSCGTLWDQDDNAARVLLARYLRERSEIASNSLAESKWAKAKRKKVERIRDKEVLETHA